MALPARRGAQIIAEGSESSATSQKNGALPTLVARTSLEARRLDDEDSLRHHHLDHEISLLIPRLVAALTVALPLAAEVSLEQGAAAHLEPLTRESMPGIAVLVARDGAIVFQGAFGFADVDARTPVTTDTKFRIGSVSKQFMAAAVMRLVDEGKLTLDDPLEKFFPDFPRAHEITLEQLLNHTSGIHSFTSKPEFMSRVTTAVTPNEVIAFFRDEPPDFDPGTKFLYNNSGYFLAGEIVAQVTGQSLDAYLRSAFFEPLGMKNTGIFNNAAPPPGIAKGYSIEDGKATPAIDWDMSWAGGAGAMYSTVGDLFLWNEALFNDRVLKTPTPCSPSPPKTATSSPSSPASRNSKSFPAPLIPSSGK